MGKYQHVCTNKNYVLRSINMRLNQLGDFKYFSIMVFKHKGDYHATQPTKYEELEELLKDYDKVYSFYEVDSLRHGEVAYDIILEE